MRDGSQYIGLDLDGFAVDYILGFRQKAAELFPDRNVRIHGQAGQQTYIDPAVDDEMVRAVFDAENTPESWWLSLETLCTRADRKALYRLDAHYDVYWVTERPERAYTATYQWLAINNLPSYPIVILSDKVPWYEKMRGAADDKVWPRLRVAVDDKPSIIQRMTELGLPIIVRDWPYNRADIDPMVLRVSSVEEFCDVALTEPLMLPHQAPALRH